MSGQYRQKPDKEDIMKTWSSLKREILALGFEKDATYERYENIIITAVNRAMTLICATVRPIKRVLRVRQDKTTEHNMLECVENFMGLFLPAKRAGTDRNVSSRQTVNGCVVIDGAGEFDIYYSAKPKRIDITTDDDDVIGLDPDVAELIPLLAAYFIWLDDDERKAVMYWNNYEDMKNQILAMDQRNKPITARVLNEDRSSIFDAFQITM